MEVHKVQNKAIIYQDILNDAVRQDFPRKYYESKLKEYKFTPLQITNLENKFAYRYSQMINIDYEKAVERKSKKDIFYSLSTICDAVSNIFKLKLKKLNDKEIKDDVQ